MRFHASSRALVLSIATVLSIAPVAPAQVHKTAPRILSAINEKELVRLGGNVSNLVHTVNDQGEADSGIQLTHIRLMLSRTAVQKAQLDQYMDELQDKSSPNYHKWLTPDQFGDLYGAAEADIVTLTSWLESHGLKVETVSKGRTNIAFSGTVAQVEDVLHVSIHSFTSSYGEQFYANTTDPRIPAALAPVVGGVAHLNTIHPRTHSDRGPAGIKNLKTNHLERVPAGEANGVKPMLTSNQDFLYIVPADAATIYDTPNTTFNANYTSGATYDGTGVKIGVGGAALIKGSTVADYRSMFLGNSTQPNIVNVDGVTSTDNTADLDEAYIDTELSGGLAPGATIYYYTSKDLTSALQTAVDDNTVDIFSLSFGECELNMSTSDNAFFNGLWQQAATQGITVTVSTGDSGSAGCDAPTKNGSNVTQAVGGLAVNGFASTPYDIAVGGTDFYPLGESDFSYYVDTSEGTPSTYYRTALRRIPESTWNDSTQSNNNIESNNPWTSVSGDSGLANITAGGGGASSCSTNTTVDGATTPVIGECTSGYEKPDWQAGYLVPSDGVRDLPDVALMAGNGLDNATWLVCSDDTTKNGGVTVTENCTKQSDGNVYFVGYGGTSTAAPAFAGILALVKQMTGDRLGQANWVLYGLFNGPNANGLNPVEIGDNSVPCAGGSPNCVLNNAGYNFLSGYDATSGYSMATGLGSVDAAVLIQTWNLSTGSTVPTVTVTPTPTVVASGSSISVAVTLAGTPALSVPTGTISLTAPGYVTGTETLVNGSAAFTIPPNRLTAGSDTITVNYSGDTNYAYTTGSATITVTGQVPVLTITPSASSLTANSSLSLAISVAGSGATPVGSVTFSGAYIGFQLLSADGTTHLVIPPNSLAAGSDQIKVAYSGDTNYSAVSETTTVTVTPSNASFSLNIEGGSALADTPGNSTSTYVMITTSNNYIGSVLLACSQTSGPENAPGNAPACAAPREGGVQVGNYSVELSITTTAPSTSSMIRPGTIRKTGAWTGTAGGATLALFFLIGLPTRRRRWISMLGTISAMAALVSIVACGGGSGGTTLSKNLGTAVGTYTFTVTATGTPAPGSPAVPVTFTVSVN